VAPWRRFGDAAHDRATFPTGRKEITMARLIALGITLMVVAYTLVPQALAGGKHP